MSRAASVETLAAVAALLSPENAKAPIEIKRALPHTSPASVQGALWMLVRAGRASFEGEMGRRRYRLVPA